LKNNKVRWVFRLGRAGLPEIRSPPFSEQAVVIPGSKDYIKQGGITFLDEACRFTDAIFLWLLIVFRCESMGNPPLGRGSLISVDAQIIHRICLFVNCATSSPAGVQNFREVGLCTLDNQNVLDYTQVASKTFWKRSMRIEIYVHQAKRNCPTSWTIGDDCISGFGRLR
jgi:hypothetical protein